MPKEPEWTILKLLKWTTDYFITHAIDSPRATAEILLAHLLNIKRIDLYLQYDRPMLQEELTAFKALIKRRIDREPVAYIVGSKEFWSLDFQVNREVLIPRPDTECLVETVLSFLPDKGPDSSPKYILELGTGSGAIIIAIASERPNHHFFASDITLNAITLARANAEHHHLEQGICFFSGDWFQSIGNDYGRFDMIVSNPPYIPTRVIETLQPEIVRYEPVRALDGGEDGLKHLKQIIETAHLFLKSEGRLLLEMGFDQKDAVCDIVNSIGHYKDFHIIQDYGGHDRVAGMVKK